MGIEFTIIYQRTVCSEQGHPITSVLDTVNASGDPTSILVGETCLGKLDRQEKNPLCPRETMGSVNRFPDLLGFKRMTQTPQPEVRQIIERVLQLEKDRLDRKKNSPINDDILQIIKEIVK